MQVGKITVFALVFIVLATFLLGGFKFMSPVIGSYSLANPHYSSQPIMEYPTTACTSVSVQQGPDCYRKGVNACKMVNTAHCFQQCVREVQVTCKMSVQDTIGSRVRLPVYTLPVGFEESFKTSERCMLYAFEKCRVMTDTQNDFEDCFMRAQLPCSEIGRLKV